MAYESSGTHPASFKTIRKPAAATAASLAAVEEGELSCDGKDARIKGLLSAAALHNQLGAPSDGEQGHPSSWQELGWTRVWEGRPTWPLV